MTNFRHSFRNSHSFSMKTVQINSESILKGHLTVIEAMKIASALKCSPGYLKVQLYFNSVFTL